MEWRSVGWVVTIEKSGNRAWIESLVAIDAEDYDSSRTNRR